ncbi:MAG: hypothetical protein KatS3mg131_3237 [Candidatus Tectimicrobiota bacterium]|nr:MAG: hypothetical protein KatS3mg131_3237 [Candidatus Tectomicrobia bacterium]
MIAVLHLSGPLVPPAAPRWSLRPAITAPAVRRWLRRLRASPAVRAVVLRLSSPGGSALASDLVWREVALTSAQKPCIVSMGDVAASGGYYIAMAARAIVAEAGTLTGAIGVVGGKFVLSGFLRQLGVHYEVLQRGRHAGLPSPLSALQAEERQQLRQQLEDFYYRLFVAKAAQGRGRTPEEIERVARGRLWTGRQALAAGLVDRLGGLPEAIALAREHAGIAAQQPVRLVHVGARRPWWGSGRRLPGAVGPVVTGGETWLALLACGLSLAAEEVLLLAPWDVRIA